MNECSPCAGRSSSGRRRGQMLAVFGAPAVFITLIAGLQYAVLAAVPRMLRRPAQSIVGQDRAHGVAHEANLPGETFALVALDEVVVNLISAHHNARDSILIVRARARQ